MNTNSILLSIEGDFVDSFIYSGTLFLVHGNSQLSTYSWQSILDFATNQIHELTLKRQVSSFMDDCRSWQFDFENNDRITIHIDHETLEGMELSSIYLDEWPSDINVYANNLYVCGEDGVDEYKFDWKTNKVTDNLPLKIWDEYAFMVAPNDFHRLAIAAGKNGVVTAFPSKKSINPNDVFTLIEQPSSDCEWIGRNLVSNTPQGSYLSVFSQITEKPQEPNQEYWDIVNREKRTVPETHLIRSQEQSTLKYAWLAGEKLFGINGQGEVYSHLETANVNSQFETRYIQRLSQERLLGARSGSFGTVIEYEDDLILYNESGEDLISHRPVNWRVFPRAKNYVNHLHVVENDLLKVYAYEISHHLDYFAIDTENII
jgi:hypothetical protein